MAVLGLCGVSVWIPPISVHGIPHPSVKSFLSLAWLGTTPLPPPASDTSPVLLRELQTWQGGVGAYQPCERDFPSAPALLTGTVLRAGLLQALADPHFPLWILVPICPTKVGSVPALTLGFKGFPLPALFFFAFSSATELQLGLCPSVPVALPKLLPTQSWVGTASQGMYLAGPPRVPQILVGSPSPEGFQEHLYSLKDRQDLSIPCAFIVTVEPPCCLRRLHTPWRPRTQSQPLCTGEHRGPPAAAGSSVARGSHLSHTAPVGRASQRPVLLGGNVGVGLPTEPRRWAVPVPAHSMTTASWYSPWCGAEQRVRDGALRGGAGQQLRCRSGGCRASGGDRKAVPRLCPPGRRGARPPAGTRMRRGGRAAPRLRPEPGSGRRASCQTERSAPKRRRRRLFMAAPAPAAQPEGNRHSPPTEPGEERRTGAEGITP